MGDMVTLMNGILTNGTTEYRDRVPQATKDNIASVAAPILAEYSPIANEFMNMLVNRIAMTMVRNRTISNPLSILKKGGVPLGNDIQEIFTNPAKADHYDITGSGLLTQKVADSHVAYHRLNRQDKYKVSITKPELQRAFVDWNTLEQLVNTISDSLYSGDNFDEFILMKNLFASAVANSQIKITTVDGMDVSGSQKGLAKTLRTVSGLMTFPSSNFNNYSTIMNADNPTVPVNPIITWTPRESQIILMRTDVLTEVDVEVLAFAFQLNKADFLAKVLEIDDFGVADNCLSICADESWVQVYENLQEMAPFYNPDNLTWTYTWHHWQTYSLSPFANAMAFCTAPPSGH